MLQLLRLVYIPINAIIFSFSIGLGLASIKGIQTDIKYQHYYYCKFCITLDPLKYEKLIKQCDATCLLQVVMAMII